MSFGKTSVVTGVASGIGRRPAEPAARWGAIVQVGAVMCRVAAPWSN